MSQTAAFGIASAAGCCGPARRPGTLSAEDHAELVARYGELIPGLQRLFDPLRPEV